MNMVRKFADKVSTAHVVIILCGVLLSIVGHELAHLVLHFGHIAGIHILPTLGTGMEILVIADRPYDIDAEEFLAYAVSALIIVATSYAITKYHDRHDLHSVTNLLGIDSPELNFSQTEIAHLAYRVGII